MITAEILILVLGLLALVGLLLLLIMFAGRIAYRIGCDAIGLLASWHAMRIDALAGYARLEHGQDMHQVRLSAWSEKSQLNLQLQQRRLAGGGNDENHQD